MGKFIKWLVVGVVAIAVLIKLSLWWSVRTVMDEAIAVLSPFVEISYEGVTSSFDGRVGLKGIKVNAPLLGDGFTIEHGELKFSSLSELLRFRERMAEGKFPEQLALELKGLAVDVHGTLMQQLQAVPAEKDLFTALNEVACGKVEHIGTLELLDMGYRTMHSDVGLSYRLEPGAQKLTLNLQADTQDMLESRLSLALVNVSDNPGDLMANPPRLASLTMEMNDNQYLRKVQAFCAGKLGLSAEAYRKVALEKFDNSLRRQRLALGATVLEAYSRYLQDPQALRLEIRPSEGMAWDGLQFFEPKDVLQMVRPVLLVNHQVVEPLEFTWATLSGGKELGALDRVVAEESLASREQTRQYDFVPVEQLAQYAGKRLQLRTHEGTYYEGMLHRVENGRAYLTVQYASGSAEMFLRVEKIDKVRVNF